MKKKQILEGIVEKTAYPDTGLVRVAKEELPVTVKNVIPGQKIRFVINKFKNGRPQGRLLEVLEKSPLETRRPVCGIFPECGGCTYQAVAYEDQLKLKSAQIKELLDAAVKTEYIFEGIRPSPKEFGSRNKMEFSFGDEYKGGPLSLGLHKKGGTYDVLTAGDCKLVHEDMNKILLCVFNFFKLRNVSFYRKQAHKGYLRHLLLRRGDATGEILVSLVTTTQEEHDLSPLTAELLNLGLKGQIVGILHIFNDFLSDSVRSDRTKILYGRDYFYEKIMGMDFKITPFSFFQPNTGAAEALYKALKEYIGDIRGMTVFDLYCGTGTISQILAPEAKKAVGIEIVEEAVAAARENAERNGLRNCSFIAGDVLKVLDTVKDRPDVIVLDPPREGVMAKALSKILDYGADNIVYISCKATSLARDLEMIQEKGYRVMKAVCIDQFCETFHVETVALLSKREIDSRKVRVEFSMEGMGKEDEKVLKCPPEKELAISEAFNYFGMI